MTLTPRVDAIVRHQLARWQASPVPSRPAPCVALSRLPGAGGYELGRRIADALHYGFFGSEIVDQIAAERGIGRELLHGLDEHVRHAIDRFVIDAFQERRFTEGDYLRDVARIVSTLGRRGEAVILGRGAAFILPPEQALRVLVVAPRPARVERAAKEHGFTLHEAEAWIDREDSWRAEFVRHHFGLPHDDPIHYDLAVNTTTLGIDLAAASVVRVHRERFGLRR